MTLIGSEMALSIIQWYHSFNQIAEFLTPAFIARGYFTCDFALTPENFECGMTVDTQTTQFLWVQDSGPGPNYVSDQTGPSSGEGYLLANSAQSDTTVSLFVKQLLRKGG